MVHKHGSDTPELTLEDVNQQINSIFASNNVVPDGPGEEAFWNAVEEVEAVNVTAAEELCTLSERWHVLHVQAVERCHD